MNGRIGGRATMLAILILCVAGPVRAAGLDESGTVGLSVFGDYGAITGNSRYGLDFNNGGGYGVTLRYVVGPHWSVGLFFQNQSYDAQAGAVSGPQGEEATVDKLVVTEYMADLYYYRDRKADASQYLVAGIGFYRPEVRSNQVTNTSGTVVFPGENLVVSAGLGVEAFIREDWGIDLSGRVFGYLGKGLSDQELGNPDVTGTGSFAAGLQLQAGLFYYLMR